LNFIGTSTVTENLLKRKWSFLILRHLCSGLTNPDDIRKLEPDLPSVALNERLRTMHRYGLISRHPRRASGVLVAYHLTDRGHKILRLLILIEKLDEVRDEKDIELKLGAHETPPSKDRAAALPPNGKSARRRHRTDLTST
jgi:DNA-binding HxlR family transcriptional regulator